MDLIFYIVLISYKILQTNKQKRKEKMYKNITINSVELDVVQELKKHCIDQNITMRMFLINLIKKELKIKRK